jgi:hypothetical protein
MNTVLEKVCIRLGLMPIDSLLILAIGTRCGSRRVGNLSTDSDASCLFGTTYKVELVCFVSSGCPCF